MLTKLDNEIIKTQKPFWLCGCDEVGRGCLAGPVVAACVGFKVASNQKYSLGVTDSKALSEKKRQEICRSLDVEWSFKKKEQVVLENDHLMIALVQVSPEKIDQVNIFQASLLAMSEATNLLKSKMKNPYLLVDGKWDLGDRVDLPQEPVIKGDSKSWVIGLASIVAKEFRDSLMKNYDEQFPGFQFGKHAGYPTKFHKEAIAKHGIIPIHRKTFRGVKEYVIKKD